MKPFRLLAFMLALSPFAGASVFAETEPGLEAGFQAPPHSAKPQTLWHWISGNVTREGITADLEAMRRIGLGGAYIVDVYREVPRGAAAYMSPQWRELVVHAINESHRLGLELSLANCEGWSESGGPWVTPAESMQQVVWSETLVSGGRRISLATLPEPSRSRGHYSDIGVVAFPARAGDTEMLPKSVKTPRGAADLVSGFLAVLPLPKENAPEWIVLDYGEPVVCRSIRIETELLLGKLSHAASWRLQASDDGSEFRPVSVVSTNGTTAFAETRARYFRLWIANAPSRTPRLAFTKIALGGPRFARTEPLAALETSGGISPPFGVENFPNETVISRGAVIDLTGRKEWDAPPGAWTVLRFGHTTTGRMNHPVDPQTEGLECDKMSRTAVEAHFRNGPIPAVLDTMNPSARNAFKGVFMDSWEAGCANWTPLMREEFRKRREYDLLPWLPALTGRVLGSTDLTERFLWDFRRTIADLVSENHYGALLELSKSHGLEFHAEALGAGTRTVGDQLAAKERTTIPMGEFWVKGKPRDDTKETAGAAHIFGQRIAAAEAFSAAPENADWTNDPASLKSIGDMEFCRGINRFVFHRYAHQPWLDRAPGMTLGFWGIHFERTNTWWEPAIAWMDYISRCQFLLQRGDFVADVCYFYGEGAPVELQVRELDPAPAPGYDFDACNTDALMQMTVRDGRIVLPSGMSYRALVLPKSDRMTLRVLRKVRELVRAGALVIAPRPVASPSLAEGEEADASIGEIASELWGQNAAATQRVLTGVPLENALGVPPDLACDDSSMRFIHRRDENADFYFVANISEKPVAPTCQFRIGDRVPELWHPDTGKRETLAAYSQKNGRTTLTLPLGPSGSVFVVFRHSSANDDPVVSGFSATESSTLVRRGDGKTILRTITPGAHAFATASGLELSATVPRLPATLALEGYWRVRFPIKIGPSKEIDFPRLQSWAENDDEAVKYFSGTATYTKTLTPPVSMIGPERRIWLDLGDVKNLAAVRLNGRPLGIFWKPPFRIDVTDALRAGDNLLEIDVTNLWPNRLIGDQRLPEIQRTTWTTHQPYRADSPLLPSGLLGKVTLQTVAEVPLKPTSSQ